MDRRIDRLSPLEAIHYLKARKDGLGETGKENK